MTKQGKQTVLILSGITGLASITYSIYTKKVNKKKDSRSYEFQRLLETQLEPEKEVVSEQFDTDSSKIDNNHVNLNGDELKSIAKNIWDSFGGWLNDNEEKIYSQLRLISTFSEYRLMAKEFIIIADGVSLDFELKDRLSTKEYKICKEIFDSYTKK